MDSEQVILEAEATASDFTLTFQPFHFSYDCSHQLQIVCSKMSSFEISIQLKEKKREKMRPLQTVMDCCSGQRHFALLGVWLHIVQSHQQHDCCFALGICYFFLSRSRFLIFHRLHWASLSLATRIAFAAVYICTSLAESVLLSLLSLLLCISKLRKSDMV